jgi:hypothetical protein
MDARYRRALALGVLGVALLANPLYLYPKNVSAETTYTFEATPTERIPERADTLRIDIETCAMYPLQSVDCAVAREMARGDSVDLSLRPDETVSRDLSHADFVRTLDGYHRPNVTVDDETLRVTLEPVSRETVRAAAAENVSETPPHVRRAVENGTATVGGDDLYEARNHYVYDGETYYLVEAVESRDRPTGWGWREPSQTAVEAMRLAAWAGGVICLWRAGEWSERGRRAAHVDRRRERRERRRSEDCTARADRDE